jgi:hypothetical protein
MIKLKKIIKEAFGDRKFGEPLPTFDSVMNDYQAGKLYTDKDKPPFKTPNQIEEETITEAKKSDVKKMEKMANKILSDMVTLNKMFAKLHDSKTSNPSAYRTLKDWEQLQRDASVRYGGWFEFVYDSDNVE